jgi:hypothetical protein
MFRKLLPGILGGWIVVGVLAFRRLPGPIAVLVLTVLGTLFLPEVQSTQNNADAPEAVGVPLVKLTKYNVISYALLAGSLVCDRRRWAQVQPRWFDLPMAAWCLAPFFASITNDLGVYDGGAGILSRLMLWGVPYWMGRLYLGTREGLLAWTVALVLGGLIYVPFAMFEVRMSPQLHVWVYGFFPHDFKQMMRDGSFRPTVFMEHALTLAQFMAAATLAAWWLWSTGTIRKITLHRWWQPVSLGLLAGLLAVTSVLCRSYGPLVLGITGVAALAATRALRSAVPLFVLILIPPLYLALRYTEAWDGQDLVAFTRQNLNEERAASLDTRFKNEYALLKKSKERPNFGWGGYGRWRLYDDMGHDITISDSLWIITVCSEGLFGLAALLAVLLVPAARFLSLYPPRKWVMPFDAGPPVAATLLATMTIDHLVNAAHNPILLLGIGALSGAAGLMAQTTIVAVPITEAPPPAPSADPH